MKFHKKMYQKEFLEILTSFQKKDVKKELQDYMKTKNLSSKKSILDAFKKAFEHGYVGFHVCPTRLFTEDHIKNFFNDIFDISPEERFFYVKACSHDHIVIYVDPRKMDQDHKKYIYEGNYVLFCFDV